jgi:cell division protein FtsB
MRIGRSVRSFFTGMIFPAIAVAVTAYFGYHFIYGPRGYHAYNDVEATLALHRTQLAVAQDARKRLEHRITLMQDGSVDPDLVEELARTQLMDGASGQVAIPRDVH